MDWLVAGKMFATCMGITLALIVGGSIGYWALQPGPHGQWTRFVLFLTFVFLAASLIAGLLIGTSS